MTGPSLAPHLSAVLFDMDGLLVDSEPVWTVAERELAASLGGEWNDEIKAAVLGTSLSQAVPTILDYYGATDREPADVAHRLLARMVELYRGALPMRPGAMALLDALHGAGMPLALVSSSYRVLVDAALDELGHWRFAATVAGDEVRRGKPHPEPYLTAAGLLGVDPRRCVVFEDSAAGVAAAEAAGCVVVGVPDHAPLDPAPGRTVIGSLAEVDVDWLLRLTAPSRG